jgi:hypothetical protein
MVFYLNEKDNKKNKATWFNEGFKILKTFGAAGLTIEDLTKRLKKQKGFFIIISKARMTTLKSS